MKIKCGWTHEQFPDSKFVCDVVKDDKKVPDLGWVDCKDACFAHDFSRVIYNYNTRYCQCLPPMLRIWK